jgi:hypothetical protein
MTDPLPTTRFIDVFRDRTAVLGLSLNATYKEVGTFGDLEWSPGGGAEALFARAQRDPAFIVVGATRYLAFANVLDDLRYFAAPLLVGADEWRNSDAERRRLIEAEPDRCELGIVVNVHAAATLAAEYLNGVPFEAIRVPRVKYGRSP